MPGRTRDRPAGRARASSPRRGPEPPPPPGPPDVPLSLWGTRLREARRARGLTQPQLAKMAGLAQQSVSKVERGEACPHDQVKLQLARALGVNPGTLFPWPKEAEGASR